MSKHSRRLVCGGRWLLPFSAIIFDAVLLFTSSNFAFSKPLTSPLSLSISTQLQRLNKPSRKTIQSPDGDVIDCVPVHLQPAFDLPELGGEKLADHPERPNGLGPATPMPESFQSWTLAGEACPKETVPIRRVTEADILRTSLGKRFGKKPLVEAKTDSSWGVHEHAIGYVNGGEYFGAKASLNVWASKVASSSEFSVSQIWILSGSFSEDLNTIEAGWQVNPQLYGDDRPRFFTYWTANAYQSTGCYNLLCSGFVQTNNRIAMGASISPLSTYNGGQFDITLLIWKDPKHGNWWLELGGVLVGYWPAFLFSHLKGHGSMVQFGGEILNTRPRGSHTATQMGSGHFSGEGFGRSSYFRNIQVVDWDNNLIPVPHLQALADHCNCYDIETGRNSVWGDYFYYGGPGRSSRCL